MKTTPGKMVNQSLSAGISNQSAGTTESAYFLSEAMEQRRSSGLLSSSLGALLALKVAKTNTLVTVSVATVAELF